MYPRLAISCLKRVRGDMSALFSAFATAVWASDSDARFDLWCLLRCRWLWRLLELREDAFWELVAADAPFAGLAPDVFEDDEEVDEADEEENVVDRDVGTVVPEWPCDWTPVLVALVAGLSRR